MEEEARAELEAQLIALYGEGESEEKQARRKLLFNDDGSINGFQRIGLRQSLEQRDSAPPPPAPTADQTPIPTPPPDLAADIPEPVPGYDDRVDLVAAIKGRIDILVAVQSWGKSQGPIKIGNRTEGIHVRCPFPSHTDNNPSAWINTIKSTWYCGVCQTGGDQIDFYAAAVHGLASDDFHHDKEEFREILEELAVLLGIDLDPPVPPVDRTPPSPPDLDQQFEEVVQDLPDDEPPEDWDADHDPLRVSKKVPTYREWRNLCPQEGTFWHEWIAFHEEYYGWVPPEYSMMVGALLIGLACGHHQYAENGTEVTTGTMMLTIVALSTIGKTKMQSRVKELLWDATDIRWNSDFGTGVHVLTSVPGSAEAFLEDVRHEHEAVPGDPSSMMESSVTSLLIVTELNSFMAKAKSHGVANNYRDTLIQFWDFHKRFPDQMEQVAASHSKTHGRVVVHDAFFSALFATQIDMVRRNFTTDDIASGFFNRLIPVYGERVRKRSLRYLSAPASPSYIKCFENLWKRLRGLPIRSMLPISEEAIDFLESDPYSVTLADYGQHDAVLARLNHHMHKIAFFLAVDEDRPEVDLSCYKRSLHLTRYYLEPCFAAFYAAVKATESKDLVDQIVHFIQSHFERTSKWPEWRALCQQTFWRNAEAQDCKRAWEGLRDSHQLARLKVQADGGRGAGVATAVLTMESPWTQFAGLWDKRESAKVLYHET